MSCQSEHSEPTERERKADHQRLSAADMLAAYRQLVASAKAKLTAEELAALKAEFSR